jgi:tetratricopeptide (TPR) repeat protein
MKSGKKMILPLVLASLSMACTTPDSLYTGNEYFHGGVDNAREGRWFDARTAYGGAWTNADLGNASDKVIAVYAYEYGRSSGVICDWNESERGLLKAYELDQKINGPIYMSLVELARMYQAKGDFAKSEEFYQLALTELNRIQADTLDAIGYANILEDYAAMLVASGNSEQAMLVKRREQEIRNVFKGGTSDHEQTPYGEFCNQKSFM